MIEKQILSHVKEFRNDLDYKFPDLSVVRGFSWLFSGKLSDHE